MEALVSELRRGFGLTLRWVTPEGRMVEGRAGRVERLPELNRLRAHALEESVHWGEPYSFFLVPGLLAWMVPGVDGEELLAGLTGTVLSDFDPDTQRDVVEELVKRGAKRGEAVGYVRRLPVWPRERIQDAVQRSEEALYRLTGWKPFLLAENRARAAQQRQIAEEIHRRKTAQGLGHPVDEERRLLALIRAGDRKGARGSLNSLLGDMFLTSPNPVVIKARAIELLGYLVRAAVENSPHLEPLIEKNHRWTTALITTGRLHGQRIPAGHVTGQCLGPQRAGLHGRPLSRAAHTFPSGPVRRAQCAPNSARAQGGDRTVFPPAYPPVADRCGETATGIRRHERHRRCLC